tara:strand:- start:2013 stop:3536 length:1524 start_codon:yes stop_codon:yes gene_type:complete
MSNGVVKYALPAQGQDQFQGFREELSNIDKRQKEAQQKSLGMASMIETADSTTMFGGDYSVAQKWAGQLTDNLDYYASSTERMIEFQQMTQQLTNFIDASEAYKTENFGKASEGAKPGSFMGATQRISGIDPYEDEGYRDEKTKEEYEMAYMGLSQGKDLIFNEQGQPMLIEGGNRIPLDQYQRPQNPFMPRLSEVDFEGGFEWMETSAKGHAFPDGRKDARAWVEEKAMDPKLRRKIVKDWAKRSGNTAPIEDLLKDSTIVNPALEEFYRGAMASFETHYGEPKPEEIDESKTLRGRYNALVSGAFVPGDIPTDGLPVDEGDPVGRGPESLPQEAVTNGIDRMLQLAEPVTSLDLEPGTEIVGFNVDGLGRIFVTISGTRDVSGTGDASDISGMPPKASEENFMETILATPAMIETLMQQENALDEDIIQYLFKQSELNMRNVEGSIDEKNRQNRREAITREEEMRRRREGEVTRMKQEAFSGPKMKNGGLIDRITSTVSKAIGRG